MPSDTGRLWVFIVNGWFSRILHSEVTCMMRVMDQDILLKNYTTHFVKNVCTVFKDMMNADFTVEPRNTLSRPLVYVNGMTVISHFSGAIQGDFLLSTDEGTASKVAGVYNPDEEFEVIQKKRAIYSDMMCEVLNVSANCSLEGLCHEFGRLTLLPPAWVFGEYHMADYISGVGRIDSLYGSIQCCLALNMTSLSGMKFS
jgi:CheY-specific phosphatase CheX